MNLDAYTVRKAVPRILVAAIGINLSIYFCVAAVDITNIIGRGIADLLTQPFLDPNTFAKLQVPSNAVTNGVPIGGALIGSLIVGGAIFTPAITGAGVLAAGSTLALGVLGFLVPMMITIALISLAIMFTLVIRQALLVFLTVVSPVAIALFVLPGTEKYFKSWFDLFIKTLLVYPIIAVLFAMSTVMGAILLGTAGSNPAGIGLVVVLAVVVVVFAPLILIPFAFKLAGGAIGALMNATSARAGNLSQRAGKRFGDWRKNPDSLLGKYSAKKRDDAMKGGATAGQVFGGIAGGYRARKRGDKFREGYTLASEAIEQEHGLLRQKELRERHSNIGVMNNDDALEAGAFIMNPDGSAKRDAQGRKMYRNEAEMSEYLQGKGYAKKDADQNAAMITRARATASQKEWDTFAVVQLAGTGTGFETKYRPADGINDLDSDGSVLPKGAPVYAGGGLAAWNQALTEAADGDAVTIGNQVAAGRSKFAEARRFDTQAGYGTQMKVRAWQEAGQKPVFQKDEYGDVIKGADGTPLEVKDANGNTVMEKYTAADAHRDLSENAMFVQGPGPLVGGRGNSTKSNAPFLAKRVMDAKKKWDKAVEIGGAKPTEAQQKKIDDFKKAFVQQLASTEALHEVAGQISQENAQVFADNVYTQEVDGKPIIQWIEETRATDKDYGAMKGFFGTSYTQQIKDAEQSAQAQAQMLAMKEAGIQGSQIGGPQGPTMGTPGPSY